MENFQTPRSGSVDGGPAIIYVALHQYVAKKGDELSFKRGELLEMMHAMPSITNPQAEDWWYAKSQTTKKEGYIPSNYVTIVVASQSQSSPGHM